MATEPIDFLLAKMAAHGQRETHRAIARLQRLDDRGELPRIPSGNDKTATPRPDPEPLIA